MNFYLNSVKYRFKNMFLKDVSYFLRLSSLETKERQMRSEFRLVGLENSQTPSTSKVLRSDHREDVRSCAWPFYSLLQIFPK